MRLRLTPRALADAKRRKTWWQRAQRVFVEKIYPEELGPMGQRRTRCLASSTTMIRVPSRKVSLDCSSTSRSLSITRSVRVS
jgi:hypothetical protein